LAGKVSWAERCEPYATTKASARFRYYKQSKKTWRLEVPQDRPMPDDQLREFLTATHHDKGSLPILKASIQSVIDGDGPLIMFTARKRSGRASKTKRDTVAFGRSKRRPTLKAEVTTHTRQDSRAGESSLTWASR